MSMDAQSKMSMVKKLVPSRNGVVELLRLWLMNKDEVNEEEVKRLWKANKRPRQHEWMENLLPTIRSLDLNLYQQYFQGLLMTIKNEFGGLDYFNLDKLNILLCFILRHMHLILFKNGWDCKIVKRFMDDMVQRTLLAVDKPQGLKSYFVDMYLNELHCLLPVQLGSYGCLSVNRLRFKRLNDNTFECSVGDLQNHSNGKEEQDVDKKEEILGWFGVTNRLLQLSSLSSTGQENRNALSGLQKEFCRLYQHFTASGFMISLHEHVLPLPNNNVAKQHRAEMKTLLIQDINGGFCPSFNSQQMNNIENISQVSNWKEFFLHSNKASGKAQLVDSFTKEKMSTAKNGNGLSQSLEKEFIAEAADLRDSADDVVFHHTCSYKDSGNDVNEEQRLKVVYTDHDDMMMLDASPISNLEQPCEEAAAELDSDASPAPYLMAPVSPLNSGSKKRRREPSPASASPVSCHDNKVNMVCSDLLCEFASAGKSAPKRVKRVKFCLKNNIVWRPHNPLPPESLRVPPSATPRGSALKKGVPPGPICIIKKSPNKKSIPKQKFVATRKSTRTTKSVSTSTMVLRKTRPVAR